MAGEGQNGLLGLMQNSIHVASRRAADAAGHKAIALTVVSLTDRLSD
jgi:hypothetical protein